MQNFLYKIRQFMYGRNGIDGLGIFLFVLNIFLRYSAIFSRLIIFEILSLAVIIFAIYRIFSKNIYQRQRENAFFMKYFNKVYFSFKRQTSLARERAAIKDTHKIFLCPKCKRKLKVPKKRGKIEISCPCGNKFKKRT